MKSRNLDNMETLDNSARTLASDMKTLSLDVREIRNTLKDIKPWLKVVGWILSAAGIAAIVWAVTAVLEKLFG